MTAQETKSSTFTVDMHCHVLTLEVERLVAGCPQKLAEPEMARRMTGIPSAVENERQIKALIPKLTDVDVRLREMDAMGINFQVISPSPSQYYYWAEVDLAKQLVAAQNGSIAFLCAQHPDRLAGLGNIALQHAELALEQLTHCVKSLGLRGVEISSAVSGVDLADQRFEKFWAKAEELDCVVFLHPWGCSLGERLNQHYLANIIGQPIETTVAISKLIFGGVLDRYPRVKICAAHGGGYLPSYIGRSDWAYRVRAESRGMKRKPSEYLRQIYFDTVVYTPEGLRHLIEQVGVTQVVLGTDYPFDMGFYDVHGLISSVPGLAEQERDLILGGNAARLCSLKGYRGVAV